MLEGQPAGEFSLKKMVESQKVQPSYIVLVVVIKITMNIAPEYVASMGLSMLIC